MTVPTMGAKRRSKLAAVAGAAATMLVLAACGGGDDDGDSGDGFYAGKTIELIVPLSAGGGTDTTMRIFAKHLPRFLDGNPEIVVINEENGGNSIIGANDYVANGSDDGLRLLGFGASNLSAVVHGNQQVEYTPNEDFTPLVATTGGGVMVARADTGLTKGADLKNVDTELFFGGRRPDGSFLKRILGLDILDVEVTELLGYEGASDITTAFLQGETNINGMSPSTFFSENLPEVEKGNQVVLYTEGFLDENNEIGTDPAMPEYPTIADVYEEMYGEPPSGEAWDAYTVLAASDGGIDRTVWIHEDAPQEAVDELTAAFNELIKDPEFLEEANADLGEYPIMTGEEATAYVDENILNADRESLAYVKEMAMDRYGIDLAEG